MFEECLYGVLVSLTGGESKGLLRNVVDLGGNEDGYRDVKILQKQFDSVSIAILLHAYLEVVAESPIKGAEDIISGMQEWEAKVSLLVSVTT